MANTGYIINNTVRQYFTTGPNSGSSVTGSEYDVDLTIPPFSSSLDGIDYYNRAYEPNLCKPGFETCLVPLLTGLTTGSNKGRFVVNYVTQSSFNTPINITASVSNDPNFSTSESFYATIDGTIPITSSYTSGTVYFRAFTSCSGPEPSPLSDPLSFTYNIIPPTIEVGNVFIRFKNNYSSTMEVNIRSLRGNVDYIIPTRQSVTYDYSTLGGKAEDLTITIKGGAKNANGNYILRRTNGDTRLTYTTGKGFENPTKLSVDSSKFIADKGITFNVKQLYIPTPDNTTTTTFTLVQATPPISVAPTLSPISIFGSVPYATQNETCGNSNINFKEKNYYKLDNFIYNTLSDAQSGIKPLFPYNENYILTSVNSFLIVNKEGRIQSSENCNLPTIDIYTLGGPYSTQEEACSRTKTSGGTSTYEYKDNTIVDSIGQNLSGRYPLYSGINEKGGRNILLSTGKIIGYENCGTELTNILFSSIAFTDSRGYTLDNIPNTDPTLLSRACAYNSFTTFSQGPSGVIYYSIEYIKGLYKYIPLGLGTSWRKTTDGSFVKFDKGIIIDRVDPC